MRKGTPSHTSRAGDALPHAAAVELMPAFSGGGVRQGIRRQPSAVPKTCEHWCSSRLLSPPIAPVSTGAPPRPCSLPAAPVIVSFDETEGLQPAAAGWCTTLRPLLGRALNTSHSAPCDSPEEGVRRPYVAKPRASSRPPRSEGKVTAGG